MSPGAFVCDECGLRYDRAGRCAADGRALAETGDALLGTEIGSYRLAKLLGRGGMGRVYLGVQPAIGGRVAIKVLSEDACEQPDAVARFIAEARAVNLIRHDGIVGVHDFVQLPGGRPAIVMELVDGRTLRDLLELGALPIGGIVNAMLDVLGALAAAHAIGIIHRDLKPDNVIVATSGRAKLLDFGIAKLAQGEPGQPRTRTGAVLGTPHYMSPEQIQGDALDARSDLYSLGVLLFETLTRQRPFERASDFELMMAHVNAPLPSARALRPEIPIEIEQVLERALAKRRTDRFRSASAMATALHSASGALPPEAWRSVLDPARVISRAVAVHVLAVGTPSIDESGPGVTLRDRPSARRHDAPTAPPVRARTRKRAFWIVLFAAIAAAGAGITTLVVVATRAPGSPPVILSASRRLEPVIDPPPPIGDVSDPHVQVTANNTPAPPTPADAAGGVATTAVPIHDPMFVATRTLSGDPRRFDPVAYVPTARELAHSAAPGAELVTMVVSPIQPGGLADLTAVAGEAVYLFRSDHPDANGTCAAASVIAKGTHVRVVATSGCDRGFKLRCSTAQVWTRALATIPDDKNATYNLVRMAGTPTWVVASANHRVATFADDCDGTSATTTKHTEPIKSAVDYDIHRFDLIAWLPSAQNHARELATDARMYGFEAMGVAPDGHIDLKPPDGTRHWTRSVWVDYRASAKPCSIRVVATDHRAQVMTMSQHCSDAPAPALPTCTLAQVFARGLAKSDPRDTTDVDSAIIQWRGDKRQWTFKLWDYGPMLELDDGC